MRQVHVYVIGDVIGVGFRAWTKIQAKDLQVNGWVRNVHDKEHVFGRGGGVEAIFQGTEYQLNQMIQRIKAGPSIARVDDVEVYWQEVKDIFPSFEIRK
ncbi:MAG: acylphosphatase [Patescibacteria group bacterium]|nr:acylphosphatase [Patescibacteria group bacterium]